MNQYIITARELAELLTKGKTKIGLDGNIELVLQYNE